MLSEFVRDTLGEPFDWGRNNCALWTADAVRFCTGMDPAARHRSDCTDWASCRRLVIRSGGLLRMAINMMDPLGFDALSGDGVAVARAEGQVLCGVVLGGRLVAKTDRGGRFHDDFDVLRGWSWHRL